MPSFAFIGWNPFQIRHVLGIARKLENSCIVIEKRQDHVFNFDETLLTESGVPVVIWSRNRIKQLDGLFDVIVCQTPFSQMESITKSRIAMIQYGYAKEAHNYGDWRSAASLCLAYGDYAAEKLRPMCPVAVTGNPGLDPWHNPDFHEAARNKYGKLLDPSKKTVIYAPTWGDLSTTNVYLDEVLALHPEHNVLLKLHHNTDLLEKEKRRHIAANAPIHFGANDNLLDLVSVSDVVLSDYSGAIFDALYCQRPVVLLHSESAQRFGEKLNPGSLEYAARHRIGPVLEQPGNLRATVRDVLLGTADFSESNRKLTADLYLPGPGSEERAAAALKALALQK
ncbi:MAG: CDP-glycerol glycerophosphotransferase family protein [Verrucomicrobiota bacterium]